jgi:hypothetical protein
MEADFMMVKNMLQGFDKQVLKLKDINLSAKG